ncbi:alpha/beta hydrolase [Nocardioides donggukensis]|uniref:Alpha/beta hydrolase n=1 Tax=Nocardioides donggukensis TaxID=2774019 RepID=A0A927Q380_9ACTN|nr:alpha/beta hydrolase [Nocardioides donggukensis]MBD8871094.1 alpha/beta hydrolase [Nocardioides donggukensis]
MIEIHDRTSLRSVAVRVAARAVVRPVLSLWPVEGPLGPARHVVEVGARALPRLRSTTVEHVQGDGWTAELVRPRGAEPGREALVYFHGGAFLFCGLATHRRIVERLSLRTGLPVLSVAYRQRSSHFVETSVSDCTDAVNWLVERGYDPGRMVLVGDSAGGHLAFTVAMEAGAQGLGVAGVVGLSPWLDFDNSVRRTHANARRDAYIPTFRLDRIARQVTGKQILEPSLSPVNRDLDDLPPALLVCAADEVLRCDAELMTERLDAAGVPVDLHVWRGQVHAFPVLAHLLPESSAALDLVSSFVADALGVRERTASWMWAAAEGPTTVAG